MIRKFFKWGQKRNNTAVEDPLHGKIRVLHNSLFELHTGLHTYANHMNQWHNHLWQRVEKLHHHHKHLAQSHKQHSEGLQAHKSETYALQKELMQAQHGWHKVQTNFDFFSKHIEDSHKMLTDHISAQQKQIVELHKEIAQLKQEMLSANNLHTQTPIVPIQQHSDTAAPKPSSKTTTTAHKSKTHAQFDNLTPSEKKIIALLVASKQPLSYRQLASELDKSPATIKTQLNALRNKGISIREHTDDSNQKVFFIPEEIAV